VNILVVGGFDPAGSNAGDILSYASALGDEIVRQGHVLYNGCQTEFDNLVAGAAFRAGGERGENDPAVVSYVLAGTTPAHSFGKVLNSRLTTWDPGGGGMFVPEPIQRADAVIIVAGFEGSFRAFHWADTMKKPVLPVAYFGGAAGEIYKRVLDTNFERRFGGRIDQHEFEELNAFGKDWPNLASRVVSLAEKAAISKSVLALMSYTPEDPMAKWLKNVFHNFTTACKEFDYTCTRVDQTNTPDRIVPRILEQIDRSAFVIVDLTELKPNVLFELGYAEGLKKPRIVTAKIDTKLPFDIQDFPVTFWDPADMFAFSIGLSVRIRAIAEKQGRASAHSA
jgi:hypothetical protein